jgi:hypothetical protein
MLQMQMAMVSLINLNLMSKDLFNLCHRPMVFDYLLMLTF